MASLTTENVIGGASRRPRRAGNVSGLTSLRVREVGSGHRGKTCERPTNFNFRAATWNVGTLKKRDSEVVETLSRRNVDLCGIQEHRWAGGLAANQSRMLKGRNTRYKFFWSGNSQGLGGAGILLAESWIEKVFEVQRISDRIILIRLILGKAVFTFLSVYAPQTGLPDSDKERFYDQLQSTIAKIPAAEMLIPVGDWNGHVGADSGVYNEAHGGHGFGVRNADGERVLEFAIANDLLIGNTQFKKRDSHLVTYSSGNHRTQIDYILYRKCLRRAVRNIKVIPTEECVQQHHLVVCDLSVTKTQTKKRKFVPRVRTWKLKDPAVASVFQEVFKDKVTSQPACEDHADHVEDLWSNLREPLLDAAKEVCGTSKNHQWRPETWWWNDRVDDAVKEKRARFKVYNALKKAGKLSEAKEAKATYNEAKRIAKHVVWVAKSEAEKEVFANIMPNGDGIFRIAKQMDRSNQDVVGEKCVRNDIGELSLSDEDKMNAWVEHYARLLNVEFEWPSESLPVVAPIAGPPPSVSVELIQKAIRKMKEGKAAGPSGIIAEMVKNAGEEGVEKVKQLVDKIVSSGVIPKDWEDSHIINLYKGKGVAVDRGNYRGLKLTDQVLKLLECVMGSYIREMVNIDDMQFAYTQGRGTTDAIFTVRQMQEKHIAAQKPLYFAFVDLEKAFDRVPRKVLWWALRSLGVDEWAVRVIQAMYANARSRVRVNGQYSKEFGVGVGVHQGSVLSPLLFNVVLEALSREFRTGVPWELLYADDLVIIANSLEECIAKLKAWKLGMENKGLRVNMKKTKFLISGIGLNLLQDSGKFPCAVCRSGVGTNSILCSQCKMWVHKKCSNVLGRLSADPNYICPRCSGVARPIDGRPVTHVDIDDTTLDVETSFCYLGDMLCAGGGCERAIAARCCVAWGKFRKLLPILTSRHLSYKVRGRVFSVCVRSAMLHGSETWAPNSSDLQRLRRNDRSMIRWICGVKLDDEIPSIVLHQRLHIEEITVALRTRRLRWFGHVQRASSCINSVSNLTVPGSRRRGRPRKTWSECVKKDIVDCNLSGFNPLDRDAWREAVRLSQVLPTPDSGTTAAP